MEIDPRIVRISIEIEGQLRTFEGLDVRVTGTKFANPNQDECEVKISNLSKASRDYLLTETSPFNKKRAAKILRVEAGRKSYGTTVIYEGDVVASRISQPPDISLTIKTLTKDSEKGKIVAKSYGSQESLSTIAKGVAQDIGAELLFEATDKSISNYSHTGAALSQVGLLQDAGDVDVFVNGNQLVVKDASVPISNKTRILNLDTGMIGIPEQTEQGVKVSFLLDNHTAIGGGLTIQSKLNPSLSGNYVIYKLGFDIASRDVPFYYHAEAKRL